MCFRNRQDGDTIVVDKKPPRVWRRTNAYQLTGVQMSHGRIVASSLIAATMLAATGAGAANLVTNGDFANTNSTWTDNTGLGSNDWLSSGAVAIPGWSNVSGFANEFWANTPNSYGLTNSPGNGSAFWVDLTGQSNTKPYGGIEQTIATTTGGHYVLTFDLGASTLYNGGDFGPAALTASAGSASELFTLSPDSTNEWVTETLDFTATGSTTTVEFLADSDFTSEYTGLDNVSVTSTVPEPAGWTMMLAGFSGLGVAMRRRRGALATV